MQPEYSPGPVLLHAPSFLQQAVQRAIDLVALGLNAVASANSLSLDIPGTVGQVSPAANHRLTIDEARDSFAPWIIACGLRDCVDSLGLVLEWARKQCALWVQPGTVARLPDGTLRLSAECSGAVWNEEIVGYGARFDRLPLPRKFEDLSERYGLGRPALADAVLSINAARNCLAHRGGIVEENDLRSDGDTSLVVQWCKLELVVQQEDGEKVLTLPAAVEAGQLVAIRFADVRREYPLGSRIMFSNVDYVDLCTTFLLFAQQLEAGIAELQQRRLASQRDSAADAPAQGESAV